MKKAVTWARLVAPIRQHQDSELLVSRWNPESYTFLVPWGEFTSICGSECCGIVLEGED